MRVNHLLKTMKIQVCFIAALLLISVAFAASAEDRYDIPSHPADAFNPEGPTTQEEKLNAAELVVSGEIASIAEEKLPESQVHRERTSRKKHIAIVRVIETYKGNAAGGTLDVEFMRSDTRERPPLIDFTRGEKCTLFLVHTETAGRFRTLSPSAGKETYNYMIAGQPRNAPKNEKGVVSAVLMASRNPEPFGGPVMLTLMVVNKTQGPIWTYTDIGSLAEFTVISANGDALVPESTLGMIIDEASKPFMLMPNHFIGLLVDLSEKFKFATQGIYEVSARLPVPSASATSMPATLISNKVKITVGGQ